MERTVASIFFDDIHIDRPVYGGFYTLPAVPKDGQPSFLKVPDKIQMDPLPHISGGGQIPRVIYAEQIAQDIIAHATEKGFGMSVDCCPGVWIVREELPELDEQGKPVMTTVFDEKGKGVARQQMRPATQAEKAQMFREDLEDARSRNHKYATWLVNRGEALNEKPEERILITGRMKLAALYQGKEVEWLQDLKHDSTKACPFCSRRIQAAAVKCSHCNEVVDFEKFADLEADRAAAVKRAKNRAAA